MAAKPKDSVPDLSGEKWREAYDTICDRYRSAYFNVLYCSDCQKSMKRYNLALELSIAGLTAIVAGLTAAKEWVAVAPWLMISMALVAAVLSAIKPILRLGDAAARYAAQHGGYRELYLAYVDLVAIVRIEGRVTANAWREHEALSKRYRALEASSDPDPSDDYLEALKKEVERKIPVESLRIA